MSTIGLCIDVWLNWSFKYFEFTRTEWFCGFRNLIISLSPSTSLNMLTVTCSCYCAEYFLFQVFVAQNRLRAIEGMEGLTRLRKLDLGANRIRWRDWWRAMVMSSCVVHAQLTVSSGVMFDTGYVERSAFFFLFFVYVHLCCLFSIRRFSRLSRWRLTSHLIFCDCVCRDRFSPSSL